MTGDEVTSESSAREPLCPNCRESLRGNLRQERVVPEGGTAVAVTYCGACGWTLACLPGGPVRHGPLPFQEVAAPADERTPEGRFQLRCRELIGEIRSLGFEPNVWVAMINDLGAAGAARKLLADHHQLAVTPWLVRRGRPELTLEHEIGQPAGRVHRRRTGRGGAAAGACHTAGAMTGRHPISALRWRALGEAAALIPPGCRAVAAPRAGLLRSQGESQNTARRSPWKHA